MVVSGEPWSGLIEDIYDVALAPGEWPALLAKFGRLFNGHSGAAIATTDTGLKHFAILGSPDRANSIRAYTQMRAGWAAGETDKPKVSRPADGSEFDILLAASTLKVGEVRGDDQLIPKLRLTSSAFFNDHLRLFDFHHAFAAKLWEGPDGHGLFSLSRAGSQGPFGTADLNRFRSVQPHLQRALRMAQRLAWKAIEANNVELQLSGSGKATALLDQHGRCMFLNRAAEAMLSQSDGLRVVGARLRSLDAGADQRLQIALALVLEGGRGSALQIPRPSGRPAYALMATPISARLDSLLPRRPRAILTIVDPDDRPVPTTAVLKDLFGLTSSEAAVARGIAQGLDLSQIASELGFTPDTARQYLSRAYGKTGTNRQNDLTRLFLQLDAT